jgi:lysozyme family protein
MKDFDASVDLIIALEGGYVNNPGDPGGETKYGISKRAYPLLNIKELTEKNAKNLYWHDYWQACRCDELPEIIRLPVFDCAVNQGVNTAILLLQDVLNVRQDGVIGNKTLQAAKDANAKELFAVFMALRAKRYAENKNFFKFGTGWLTRLMRIAIEV